jgi:homoserine O-acetyltransferase/O-succinyltransferase
MMAITNQHGKPASFGAIANGKTRATSRIRRPFAELLPALAAVALSVTSAYAQSGASAANVAASSSATDASKQADAWYENYRFRDGKVLPKLHLHYATLGTPHRGADGDIDNAVLMLHWTNASGGALLTPDYVDALYHPGRPLDARRYFLIFPDNVGHGRSSKPSDGLKADFPNYGYRDLVDIQHKLVSETLGIKHLHAIIGVSMGGMNAWQWAEAYPDAMDGIMPVVAFPTKVSGRNLLWRRMVANAIESDPDWNGGNYVHQPRSLAEGYGVLRLMIDGVPRLQSAIPDEAAADKFVASIRKQTESLDANDLLHSIKSSLDYDPEHDLAAIKTRVYALNFDDDEFNPARLLILESLLKRVPQAKYAVQAGSEKSYGHLTMAFPSLWADHVAAFTRLLGDEGTSGKAKD